MNSNFRLRYRDRTLRDAILLLVLLVVLAALVTGVYAQISDDNWIEPINISKSTGANDPRIVVDSLGRSHVIWTNSSNSFVYSRENEAGWSQPKSVELPFGTRRFALDLADSIATPLFVPELVADPSGNIHALWRDDEGTLFQSKVNADRVGVFEAWTAPQQLAEVALDMDLEISASGLTHLVYVRPLDTVQFPSGIYYRQSNDGGVTWSPPRLLYHSPYFQSLDSGRANVQVATADANRVIVSWDDPLQEKLFAIHSGNGGDNWDPLIEIDQRQQDDGLDSFGPGHLSMVSLDSSVHLIWQAGHRGVNCGLYHQKSTDGGETWQDKKEVLGTIDECATDLWLVDDPLGNLLLIVETDGATYVSAWDGQDWSEPSFEGAITSFTNPLTFRSVDLSCMQPVVAGDGTEGSPYKLSVLGCESPQNRDIWVRSIELIPFIERIAPSVDPVWINMELLTTAANISSIQLVDDTDGQLHAFWSQNGADSNSSESIFYIRWDGALWSSARQILSSPDGNSAVLPSVIFDSPDKLSAAWAVGNPGDILFSQAAAARAGVPSDWSVPVQLPIQRAAASHPNIARDHNGVLYVAYAIPLNEDRGIFVSTSPDGGDNWLDPVVAFDAAESAWDMVDNPKLTIGEDGTLHLMWIRYGSPPLTIPMSIHYSRSIDGGSTWSVPDEVASDNIVWGEHLAIGERVLHRFWYGADNGIWHDISFDAGVTWTQAQRLPGSQGVAYPVDVALDGASRPHVVAIDIDEESAHGQEAVIRHWTWTDDLWEIEESLDISRSNVESLASAATVGGKLAVLYASQSDSVDNIQGMMDIFSTSRSLNLPEFSPTPLPTLTPQPPREITAIPTQQPEPTPTLFFPTESDERGGLSLPIDTSNPLIGPLVGIIPAAIVISIAFFVVVRIVRGDRR